MTETERVSFALQNRADQLRRQAVLRKNGGPQNKEFRRWLRSDANRCELLRRQLDQGLVYLAWTATKQEVTT